jgi:hypothetical protein
MFRKIFAAVVTAGALATFGVASLANASVAHPQVTPHTIVGNTTYTTDLAGYATSENGDIHMDTIRGYVTLPNLAGSGVPADSVAYGFAQQNNEYATIQWTRGYAFVWDTASCPGQFGLQFGYGSELLGTPLPPADLTTALSFEGSPVCVSGGTRQWLSMGFDRSNSHEHLFWGQSYSQDATVYDQHVPYQQDLVVAAGVAFADGADVGLVPTGQVVGFSRIKVVRRGGYTRSMAHYNVRVVDGTLLGDAPSVTSPLVLTTGPITSGGANGSIFSISAP